MAFTERVERVVNATMPQEGSMIDSFHIHAPPFRLEFAYLLLPLRSGIDCRRQAPPGTERKNRAASRHLAVARGALATGMWRWRRERREATHHAPWCVVPHRAACGAHVFIWLVGSTEAKCAHVPGFLAGGWGRGPADQEKRGGRGARRGGRIETPPRRFIGQRAFFLCGVRF